jgi:hypothetical protein
MKSRLIITILLLLGSVFSELTFADSLDVMASDFNVSGHTKHIYYSGLDKVIETKIVRFQDFFIYQYVGTGKLKLFLKVKSDKDGFYEISLPQGEYYITKSGIKNMDKEIVLALKEQGNFLLIEKDKKQIFDVCSSEGGR